MSDVDELWDLYAGARIDCEFDGRTVPLRGAAAGDLPAAAPIFVLTAYNPGGAARDRASNEADESRLERELARAGHTFWPAAGHSPDGSWSEPGVAITGIDRATACERGTQYGQLAVFELTDDELRVVECATAATVRTRLRVHADPRG